MISDQVGYGVFATELIPEGTIVYVKDSMEIIISPTDYFDHSEAMQDVIEKYSYKDENGNRIVSWDFAKYVNHCCNCNTISTGYGFEMAIRDIQKGEQITDEYGIFNLDYEMDLICSESCCRTKVTPSDFDEHYPEWDKKIKKSMPKLFSVPQPLMSLVDEEVKAELDQIVSDPTKYKSIYSLKFKRKKVL